MRYIINMPPEAFNYIYVVFMVDSANNAYFFYACNDYKEAIFYAKAYSNTRIQFVKNIKRCF